MKRTFEMVEKGWEYRTEGYTIKKSFERVCTLNTGHITLNRYGYEQRWSVYPDNERHIIVFRTLKEAKQYIIDKEDK